MTAAVLLLSACALAACNPDDDNSVSALPALSVSDDKIVDTAGNEVALRGTNLGGWLVQEGWMCPTEQTDYLTTMRTLYSRFGKTKAEELLDVYEDNWITDVDFANIAAMGLNTVRIPFTYMTLYYTLDDEGNPLHPSEYTLREDAFERFDYAVEQCKKNGLYVILDLHGAAGSQNGKDHSGDTSDIRLFDDDAYGEACRANTVAVWTAVATRYAGDTTIAAFDLLNEPEGRTGETTTAQFELYDLLYDAIRLRDPARIVIMESVWEPYSLPSPKTYGWENVMYEYHHYNWTSSNEPNKTFYNKKLMMDTLYDHDVPVLIGEFNAWGDAGRTAGNREQTDAEAYAGVLELYTGQGWHWTTWTYKVHATSGNWGLYLLNSSASADQVDPATDTEEKIRAIWSACNTSVSYTINAEHADTVSHYAAQPFGKTPEGGYSLTA